LLIDEDGSPMYASEVACSASRERAFDRCLLDGKADHLFAQRRQFVGIGCESQHLAFSEMKETGPGSPDDPSGQRSTPIGTSTLDRSVRAAHRCSAGIRASLSASTPMSSWAISLSGPSRDTQSRQLHRVHPVMCTERSGQAPPQPHRSRTIADIAAPG
jgi:hypothetical protein